MPSYDCKRCGASFGVPDDLPEPLKAEMASLARRSSMFLAISLLKDRTGTPLSEAKGIGFHIAGREGKCHRCGTALPNGEAVPCTKCRSLNLNW